jgi:hypothetical protein
MVGQLKRELPGIQSMKGSKQIEKMTFQFVHRFTSQTKNSHNQIADSIQTYFHSFVCLLLLIRATWSQCYALRLQISTPRTAHTDSCPRTYTTKWSEIYLIHKSERNIRIGVINHFCSFRWMKLRPKNETIFKRKDKSRDSNTYITLLVWGWLVL